MGEPSAFGFWIEQTPSELLEWLETWQRVHKKE